MTDKKHDQPQNDQPVPKPDPETLHTTDPQEHMSGPVSSTMQGIREIAEDNDHPQPQERTGEDRERE